MWRRVIAGLIAGLGLAIFALSTSLLHREPLQGAEPTSCAGCHPSEVAAWARSRHASAFSNVGFQVSWQRTGSSWCTQCHANTSTAQGIACASCHGAGEVLRGTHPSLLARTAHPIRHDPALTDERGCARCHQFSLPSPGALVAGEHPMPFAQTPSQDTVGEWRRSTAAAQGIGCVDCHDPHSAPGAHDHDFVRDAIEVQAHYDGTRVFATLRAHGAAHAVPTGDPFRRMELSICGPQRCEEPLASTVLERRRRPDGTDWAVASDTRIPVATGGSESAELQLVLEPEGPLPPGARWRLVYHFPERILVDRLPRPERAFVVASGRLLPHEDDVL